MPFSTNIATKPGIITGEAGPENNAAAALLFASLQPVPLIIHEETAPRVIRRPERFMVRQHLRRKTFAPRQASVRTPKQAF
jgi:hypothetical protein